MPFPTLSQTLLAAAILSAASAHAAPGGVPHTPMTAEQRDAAGTMIRSEYVALMTKACVHMYPKHASQYQKASDQWHSARKDKLSQGQQWLATRSNRAEAEEADALTDAEKKRVKVWQVEKLGVPMDRDPKITDCDLLAASLESM